MCIRDRLCLSAGSGGWSDPREGEARKLGLPRVQLFNLKHDRNEKKNLHAKYKDKLSELLGMLDKEVKNGRSTPGKPVANDREVSFLPAGVSISKSK